MVTINEAYASIMETAKKAAYGGKTPLPPIERMQLESQLTDEGASKYMGLVWGGMKTEQALKQACKHIIETAHNKGARAL